MTTKMLFNFFYSFCSKKIVELKYVDVKNLKPNSLFLIIEYVDNNSYV